MSRVIQTVNTIEVSAVCDNQCAYCPAPSQHLHRKVGLMSMETFERALGWVARFVKAGTQAELNLHGVGEPTLNKNLVEMIRAARAVTPGIINFNTNGNTMTPELAVACRDAGVTSINITAHSAESTMRAVKAIRAAGVQCNVNADFAVNPNNWGGQVSWTETVDYRLWCNWLDKGQCMITWDGQVTQCCLDAYGRGVLGTLDDDPGQICVKPFALCETCHHERPTCE